MPSAVKTIDALLLGHYGNMDAGFPTGNNARAAVEGSYGTLGKPLGGREATVQTITVDGFESFANPNQFDDDFSVNTDGSGGDGIDAGAGELPVTYAEYANLTFTATNGTTFTARMSIVQLSNGDVYMIEDPTGESFGEGFTVNAAGRQVESFNLTGLSTTRNGISIEEGNWAGSSFPVCFVAGTMILTDDGEVAVETLKQGDLVMTMDHGLQPVRWIGVQKMSGVALAAANNRRPVRIKAGALGYGMPKRDLMVSQQHRMLVRSIVAQRMFGENEVLIAAKHLELLDGVDIIKDADAVTYVHFLCDAHEVVFANGAPSETFYTGPQALKSVSPSARAEILTIFPELSDIDYKALSARKFVSNHKCRELAIRHKKNRKALLELH